VLLHDAGATVTLEKPPAPIPGRVTHHTIELSWEGALDRINENQQQQQLQGDARIRIQLEQRDRTGTWTNIYTYVFIDYYRRISEYN
jgi:hypothetical protein